MTTPDGPRGCTNYKLRQLSRVVGRHYDEYLAAAGLKGTQYSLLTQIVANGPIRATDLARRMHFDNSTLTRTLGTLERQGWVRRQAGSDGRSRLVAATAAGQVKRREGLARWLAAQRDLNARLGAGEVVRLHALLDEFTDALAPADSAQAPSS